MNNHYVSRFIIKRFSDAIKVYDIKKGKVLRDRSSGSIFCEDDIFEEHTEKAMNEKTECRVAQILDNKIINKQNIVLTREDIFTLKRYMLICSIRTATPHFVAKTLKGFLNNAMMYSMTHVECNMLPSIASLGLSDKEMFDRALDVFSSSKNAVEMAKHPLATIEMVAWAAPFLESYIAFWDAPEGHEFVLSDTGMCSEYEGFHQITGGLDVSKTSYLLSLLKYESHNKDLVANCIGLLSTNSVMYENYSIYNLTSNRVMIMINPFFRLYSKDKTVEVTPDIWPCIIQDKSLFETPENRYLVKGQFSDKDEFIYEARTLKVEDMIYINDIILSQTSRIFGYNDPMKIFDSICYHIWSESNFGSVKKVGDDLTLINKRLFENIQNSPYNFLLKEFKQTGVLINKDHIGLFEKVLGNIFKDFDSNIYIHDYLLEHPESLLNNHCLDFLGVGERRIHELERRRDEITKNGTVTR